MTKVELKYGKKVLYDGKVRTIYEIYGEDKVSLCFIDKEGYEYLDLEEDWATPISELNHIDTNEEGQYWCKHPDENGNKIPMTKVKGSSVMSKEEVEELNKIKLPF